MKCSICDLSFATIEMRDSHVVRVHHADQIIVVDGLAHCGKYGKAVFYNDKYNFESEEYNGVYADSVNAFQREHSKDDIPRVFVRFSIEYRPFSKGS